MGTPSSYQMPSEIDSTTGPRLHQGILQVCKDFLPQCHTASKTVYHLNDERENRKITANLPDWLITRWGRTVVQWRRDTGAFPPFAIFLKFVENESVIACDPVMSFNSFKTTNQPVVIHLASDQRPQLQLQRYHLKNTHILLLLQNILLYSYTSSKQAHTLY